MPDALTFSTRLGCDNCGHSEIHELPLKSIIVNYNQEERTPSTYHAKGSKAESFLNCKHCKLPHLQVLWWKEDSEVIPHANA